MSIHTTPNWMVIKVRSTMVKIQSEDEFKQRVRKHLFQIDRAVFPNKPKIETSFTSLEALKKILTQKRLELIRCIKHEKPKSIYELAVKLKRDAKNVSKEIQLLKSAGFIEVTKQKSNGRKAYIPRINFDRINVSISI